MSLPRAFALAIMWLCLAAMFHYVVKGQIGWAIYWTFLGWFNTLNWQWGRRYGG